MSEYYTPEGLEESKKELNHLKTVETKEIAKLIEHTASFGDLKENAAYHDAKDKQAFLQGRILELEAKIRNAKIIEKKQTDKVQIGSNVLVSLGGEKEKIQIVSPAQTDSLKGKISYRSPLGKSVLNKSVGDIVEVNMEENKIECKILKIE